MLDLPYYPLEENWKKMEKMILNKRLFYRNTIHVETVVLIERK